MSQVIEGINLSKSEFKKVATVVKNMEKSVGNVYADENKLKEIFEAEMRTKFDAHILFQKVMTKNNEPCNIQAYACRFAKQRPLIFLIYEDETKNWSLIDEKRFNIYDDPKGPFNKVDI